MSTLIRRDRGTLLDELIGWMGATPVEPRMRVEEYVEDGHRVVRADIPGVDPEDIRVSVEQGMLLLHAERRAEEHDEHRSEIRYGSFDRIVSLPRGTKPDDITATYADGVLTVTMPSVAEVEATVIPVTPAVTPPEAMEAKAS
jgi:HSP20 family molecular chaperone IbpA